MTEQRKPNICVDFDGVIHLYSRGWQDGTIYDTYTPGFFHWALETMQKANIIINSSRARDKAGCDAIKDWLRRQVPKAIQANELYEGIDVEAFLDNIQVSATKPAAFISIDDRAITFSGVFPNVNVLLAFKTWQQK